MFETETFQQFQTHILKYMCIVWCYIFHIAAVFHGFAWSSAAVNEPDICLFLEGEW